MGRLLGFGPAVEEQPLSPGFELRIAVVSETLRPISMLRDLTGPAYPVYQGVGLKNLLHDFHLLRICEILF